MWMVRATSCGAVEAVGFSDNCIGSNVYMVANNLTQIQVHKSILFPAISSDALSSMPGLQTMQYKNNDREGNI